MLFSFRTIILTILFISFMVFVAFFGRIPALRHTPIATLHRLIWVHIPKAVLTTDQALTGGRVSRYLMRFGNYMLHERHWTVVIFFLLVLSVSEYLFLPYVWHELSTLTKITASMAVFFPYLFLYLACSADPGYISADNLSYNLSLYPYDHALFHPGIHCRTCKILKPARSKHCSICKRCVSKADHHCIFINSCVGYGNQHYFVLLLLSTAAVTTYGGVLGLSLINTRMQAHTPWWSIWPPKDITWTQYATGLGFAIQKNSNLGASTLLAAMTSPLVWGLFGYTLYLIWCGTTTNESLKWSEWKEDMNDGYAFRRSMAADRKKNKRIEPGCARWPVETEQVLVATPDGHPPNGEAYAAGQGPWERVWSLKYVENLYDMGFWDNLGDIFVRDYTFGGKDGGELAVETKQNRR